MGYIVSDGDIPDLLVGLPHLELRRVSFTVFTDGGDQSVELPNAAFYNLKLMVDWMAKRPEFRAICAAPIETFWCWECGEEHRRLVVPA